MRVGGLVLCGGLSSRMGRPKAWLPFGDELFLPRVARIVGAVVAPVVVVAAEGQDLPPLPPEVRIARDAHLARGPLGGLAAGCTALAGEVDALYATACDVPLLTPAFVRRIVESLGDYDVAIVREGQFFHPLAAVYRVSLAPVVHELLAADRLRPVFLLERARVRELDAEELRAVDPDLDSLRNTNTPEEYADVLRRAGLP